MTTAAAQPLTSQPAAQPIALHLTRVFRATPERVFNAWTQPRLIRQWFGPAGFECYEATGDPTPGGAYTVGMRGISPARPEAGIIDSRAEGTYRELVPFSLIVFTWRASWRPAEEETTVTIRLTPVAEGTLLDLTHSGFLDREGANSHNSGWEGSLTKLEALLNRS